MLGNTQLLRGSYGKLNDEQFESLVKNDLNHIPLHSRDPSMFKFSPHERKESTEIEPDQLVYSSTEKQYRSSSKLHLSFAQTPFFKHMVSQRSTSHFYGSIKHKIETTDDKRATQKHLDEVR